MEDQVTLVDENDNEVGVEGKMAAHRSGKLHRAFSTFVFDSSGRLLLQKRASAKYHSGGFWSNTCCGHPRHGENRGDAARRQLNEEIGIDCELAEIFSFVYRAVLSSGLIEHEYDYVYFGSYEGEPVPNPEEVEDWKWVDVTDLKTDLQRNPQSYSFWLGTCLDRVIACRRNYSEIANLHNIALSLYYARRINPDRRPSEGRFSKTGSSKTIVRRR